MSDIVDPAKAGGAALLFQKKYGPISREDRLVIASRIIERHITTFKAMTKKECHILFERLTALPDYD